jgi:hypothetical protein
MFVVAVVIGVTSGPGANIGAGLLLFALGGSVALANAALTRGAASRTPPAGWYADPAGTGRLRYWSGTHWTDHLSG